MPRVVRIINIVSEWDMQPLAASALDHVFIVGCGSVRTSLEVQLNVFSLPFLCLVKWSSCLLPDICVVCVCVGGGGGGGVRAQRGRESERASRTVPWPSPTVRRFSRQIPPSLSRVVAKPCPPPPPPTHTHTHPHTRISPPPPPRPLSN